MIIKNKKEELRIKKWLHTPMNPVSEITGFKILAEKSDKDYRKLERLFIEASEFLAKHFYHRPEFEVRVFADRNSFSKATKRPVEAGWMGAPVRGKRNVIVMSCETEKETGNRMKFHSKIIHEIAHIYLYHHMFKDLTGDEYYHIPAWIDEGVCQWLEGEFRKIKHKNPEFRKKHIQIYFEGKNKGFSIPLKEMNKDLCLLDKYPEYTYGPKAGFAYSKSYLIIDYIIHTYGEKWLWENLKGHRKNTGLLTEKLEDNNSEYSLELYLNSL